MHGSLGVNHQFDPHQIAGLLLWLRSDSRVRTNSSGIVSWLNMIDGNSYDATAVSGAQPKFGNGQKGRPKFIFSGAQALTLPVMEIAQGTIIIVCRLNSEPGTGFSIITLDRNSPAQLHEMILDESGREKFAWSFNTDPARGVTPSPAVGTDLHAYVMFSTSGRYDGINQTTTTSGAWSRTASDKGSIGARVTSGDALSMQLDGDVYEIMFFNRTTLSTADHINLWGYFKDRYGL